LEYLESGAYDKLPADVYVKGFLRNYSEFLGIDEKILVKLYEKERGIKDNLEKNKKTKKGYVPIVSEKIDISSFVVTPRIIAAGLITLAVLGGFFYLYREIGSFASTPRLVILSPDNNYSTDGNSVEVSGVTDRDAKIFINEQPVLVNDEGNFRENLTVQSGSNTIIIRAVNRFEKETIENLNIQSSFIPPQNEPIAVDNPENSLPAQNENVKKLELEIRVEPGPVWVSVEADGNLVFSATMLSGATQTFQAENKIVVNSGKGKVTFIKFNGKDRVALSDSLGAVREVEFNRDTK
jgi:cytoskeletal protein RodZ